MLERNPTTWPHQDHRPDGQALHPLNPADVRSVLASATLGAVRQDRIRMWQWRCRLGEAASHASPTPQDCGVLRLIVENVQQQAHDALLPCAEFGERFDADGITLRGMMINGVGSAMRFEHAIRTLRRALRERRRDEIN